MLPYIGDKLSGLIVDVFDSVVVVQSSAIWVELHKETIESALIDVMGTNVKLIWRQAISRLNQDGLNNCLQVGELIGARIIDTSNPNIGAGSFV